MKRLLLIILSVFALSAASQAQCTALAIDSVVNDTVYFYNFSNGGSGTTYYWSFPGGTPSSATTYSLNPPVQVGYANPGQYVYHLYMVDTANNCADSTFDSVYVNFSQPSLTVNLSVTQASCNSTCSGAITANVSGGSAPYSYLWSTAQTTATISSLCPGTYTVTVTDNSSNTAVANATILPTALQFYIQQSDSVICGNDSLYLSVVPISGNISSYAWSTGATTSSIGINTGGGYSVTVSDAGGCTATESVNIVQQAAIIGNGVVTNATSASSCNGSIIFSASGGTTAFPMTYQWSTGATTQSISNLCPGNYWVNVTNGYCQESFSFSVGPNCYSLTGSYSPLTDARVYLIQENSGFLTAVDSIDVDSGYYYFNDVCAGTYYVKAAVQPISTLYWSYLPTYYGQSATWSNATAIVVSSNTDSVDINLIGGNNPGGPGFIGGLVSQGAGRAEGDPVVNVLVLLTDASDNPLDFALTDANGAYEFPSIAEGDYRVYVDILNKTAFPHEISIDGSNTEFQNKNFIVESTTIKPSDPTGISEWTAETWSVFPNPATDVLNFVGNGSGNATVRVVDLLGSEVLRSTISGSGSTQINISSLSSGNYLIEIQDGESIFHDKFVKP